MEDLADAGKITKSDVPLLQVPEPISAESARLRSNEDIKEKNNG